jgi:hypothetical protein
MYSYAVPFAPVETQMDYLRDYRTSEFYASGGIDGAAEAIPTLTEHPEVAHYYSTDVLHQHPSQSPDITNSLRQVYDIARNKKVGTDTLKHLSGVLDTYATAGTPAIDKWTGNPRNWSAITEAARANLAKHPNWVPDEAGIGSEWADG